MVLAVVAAPEGEGGVDVHHGMLDVGCSADSSGELSVSSGEVSVSSGELSVRPDCAAGMLGGRKLLSGTWYACMVVVLT